MQVVLSPAYVPVQATCVVIEQTPSTQHAPVAAGTQGLPAHDVPLPR
jgi:hypothetical protein